MSGQNQAPAGRGPAPAEVAITELLDLERIDRDLFRATAVVDHPGHLYGGQVAAQALRAAGLTVPGDRSPHSLHGYFLRGGDPALPAVFSVDRDRDGGSFSARRVVALQRGEVIFSMAASFHSAAIEEEPDQQVARAPRANPVDGLAPRHMYLTSSIEERVPDQPYATKRPTRSWLRCVEPLAGGPLPDEPLTHAALLTYVSDMSAGLGPLHDSGRSGPSIDHALWFHRPVRLDDWVLLDVVPHTVAGGRGWYTGTVHDGQGRHIASLTQEAIFRRHRLRSANESLRRHDPDRGQRRGKVTS